jgi:hypothetical protein
MKTRKIIATVVVGLFTVGTSLNFSGCSKEISPVGPKLNQSSDQELSLAKSNSSRRVVTNSTPATSDVVSITDPTNTLLTDSNSFETTNDYVRTASGTCKYLKSKKSYLGLQFHIDGGSQFYVNNNALTPPPDWNKGTDVTITMKMEINARELVTTFGPHGSTFNPPARVILSWEKMNIPEGAVPTLFYIEDDGTYTEQKPGQVDLQNKWFILYIDHFSRYALAHSE